MKVACKPHPLRKSNNVSALCFGNNEHRLNSYQWCLPLRYAWYRQFIRKINTRNEMLLCLYAAFFLQRLPYLGPHSAK
jgi:hypothetical protein